MLRVATVLSAREWEARFVAAARDSAAVKLVLRAYLPDEVGTRADSIDVVVAGAETPWVTPTRIAAWRRLGIRVVGVHPRLDRPAAERLAAGGADLILIDDLDCDQMVREIRLLEAEAPAARQRTGSTIAVTGCRGGPGITEVAVGLAWATAGVGPAALVDADLEAPSVAVRLGLPARPDLADCVDAVLGGAIDLNSVAHHVGRLAVVPGALRPTGVRAEAALDVVESLAADAVVIVDAGPWTSAGTIVRSCDVAAFVVDATPIGIVRASRIVDAWDGPAPHLILNNVHRGRRADVVKAVRRWSGLEPAVVVPFNAAFHRSATRGLDPHRRLVALVGELLDEEAVGG